MLPVARSLQEDHDDIYATKRPELDALFEVIQRHPLDYLAFGEAAEAMVHAGDARAVSFLNQGLTLHPTHPGLHRLAARLLASTGRNSQAAVEYSLAMQGTLRPHLLLTEILAVLSSTNDAAASIPVNYRADTILISLAELKREDVSERWLTRILDVPTHDLAIIDRLYTLAMARHDFAVALRAATRRLKEAHTTSSRLMLARVEYALKDYPAVREELTDVKSWDGRIDEHGEAWLLVCDTYLQQRQWDPGLECIQQLDGTGIMAMRRDELTRREADVTDQRTTEAKLKEIQDLERSMNLPIDTYLPVLSTQGTPDELPMPKLPMAKPITNPLLHIPNHPDRPHAH